MHTGLPIEDNNDEIGGEVKGVGALGRGPKGNGLAAARPPQERVGEDVQVGFRLEPNTRAYATNTNVDYDYTLRYKYDFKKSIIINSRMCIKP